MLPHLFGPDRFSSAGPMMRRISMAVRDGGSRAVWAGDRAERGRMLDEFAAVTGSPQACDAASSRPDLSR
jgi:hypothetical protein